MAVKLADQHGDGWEMTKFEPFLGKAVLTQLSPETARCRGAAALALGVKPWEVQVKPRRDGGFDLELPRTYMPSKHDSKLEEVATSVVGRDGWYVKVNAQKLTASIIPSAPRRSRKASPFRWPGSAREALTGRRSAWFLRTRAKTPAMKSALTGPPPPGRWWRGRQVVVSASRWTPSCPSPFRLASVWLGHDRSAPGRR
ncbi:hypothetical protein GCM10023063_48600 [Arthrobacter methylotrophus]|uniref:hypothetical protein n=1 Tax=Arthrobacter methylotrophus TaxID=121291 RepID=UPI0031E7809F